MKFKSGNHIAGFTLLEVLVAAAIAATALVILVGRLSFSADLHGRLYDRALGLEIAINALGEDSLNENNIRRQTQGVVDVLDTEIEWQIEPTPSVTPHFIRRDVTVNTDQETITLFRYFYAK